MRFRVEDLRPHGRRPPQALQIPDWCGCTTEYLPVLAADGWWHLVPIWEPDQTVNPLRRYGPPSRAESWWRDGRAAPALGRLELCLAKAMGGPVTELLA